MAVQNEDEFLDSAARVLAVDRRTISMQTPVPANKLDAVIDILTFNGCSIWKNHLPKDREPTLLEAAQCVRGPFGGD